MTDEPKPPVDVAALLSYIQLNLKAPKSQYNKFGEYYYRSTEDIFEAVKPHLHGGTLVFSDEVVLIGNWHYVKATATLSYKGGSISSTAYAREQESRPKMDSSQLTGGASTYARKYSANGLFLIDDTKDADTMKGEDAPKDQKQAWSKQRTMINDINGLKDKATAAVWFLSNEQYIDELPEQEQAQVKDQYENRLKQIESGDKGEIVPYKYDGTKEQDEWLVEAEASIQRRDTIAELEKFSTEFAGKIKGLDKARTGVLRSMYSVRKKQILETKDTTRAG